MIDLKNKKGLIVGIANDKSIAAGCAHILRALGADLAITYLNDKAKRYVDPIAQELGTDIYLPLDVTKPEHFSTLFEEIKKKWKSLDFIVHSIAYASQKDLHGRVIDTTEEGFLLAMQVSCYSLIKLVKYAEPLMKNGGSIVTMSYYGANKVMPNYSLMGPVKAALEMTVKYIAAEIGKKNVRVNAVSSGPVLTRAATGIKDFEGLLKNSIKKSPIHNKITIKDVADLTAFLVSSMSKNITGNVHYVDCGYNIIG